VRLACFYWGQRSIVLDNKWSRIVGYSDRHLKFCRIGMVLYEVAEDLTPTILKVCSAFEFFFTTIIFYIF
jgi:hypothetical protein